MNPLVSFAITVKDEVREFETMIDDLVRVLDRVNYPFEIVVLIDGEPGLIPVDRIPERMRGKIEFGTFEGDFSAWKNRLSGLCQGEFICQIDADEVFPERVIENLAGILKATNVDLFFFPRLNIVNGRTPEDDVRYGWRVTIVPGVDVPVINFPDRQGRLFRNDPSIKWTRAVHEVISGIRSYATFPSTAEFSILHVKSIDRQRAQNARYQNMEEDS